MSALAQRLGTVLLTQLRRLAFALIRAAVGLAVVSGLLVMLDAVLLQDVRRPE